MRKYSDGLGYSAWTATVASSFFVTFSKKSRSLRLVGWVGIEFDNEFIRPGFEVYEVSLVAPTAADEFGERHVECHARGIAIRMDRLGRCRHWPAHQP